MYVWCLGGLLSTCGEGNFPVLVRGSSVIGTRVSSHFSAKDLVISL